MRALLLAAGIGSRLRPLTNTVPKCLVEIQGVPLLDRWLELLFAAGIERVLINTHWLSIRVENHVRSSAVGDRLDLVHEVELLGTGGTVLANRSYFGGQAFLVAHADNLTDFDLPALIAAHQGRPSRCDITMLAFDTDNPQSCGILELDDENIVRRFHEKVPNPPGNLANAAVYIFEPKVVEFIAALGRPIVDLSTEVLPHFMGRILAVRTAGYHRDIGSPDSLRQAEADLAAGKLRSFAAAAGPR